MSDQKNMGEGIVKPYFDFLDRNILFKKPIICLFVILSLIIPIYALSMLIQSGIFNSGEGKYIAAASSIVFILSL
ncbi:MAG: hypothetical protein FWC06_07580 [Treponema sp.]|nr:hypothetical protein [Treponema sp.]